MGPTVPSTAPGLTVVVPCYNEGAGLRRMHTEVTGALAGVEDLEVLLVDDGSTDDTLAQMRSLAASDPRVRYLSLNRNHGLEAAQSAGFRYASRAWTAQLDCDLQFPPSEILTLLHTAAGGYDVVFGIRERRQDPRWRRWASTSQHWLARHGFGIDFPSGASSFRVVRTAVACSIAEMRQGTPYFLATVPRLGVRYACVPVEHRRRTDGGSRFRLSRLVGHSFELLFGHSWRPLNGGYLVAALGVLAALAMAVLGVAGLAGAAVLGIGSVLLGAATLASVALVGRYLHRLMLDQRRERPYYIREANVPLHPEDRLDRGVERVPPPALTTAAPSVPRSRPADGAPWPAGPAPLLVLGANIGQLPVYLEARRRGIPTIAVDKQSGTPALRHADEHLPVSIRNPEGIADALGPRRLAGVLAAGGEVGIETWCELTHRYRTRYRYPRSAAAASRNKATFHAIAAAAGVNTYRWRHHTEPRVLVEQAAEVGFPLVVKPADSSGKKGVTLVRTPEQLTEALAHAARFTFGAGLIIEQFLTGRDLTVDVLMRGGTAVFAAVHDKLTAGGDTFLVRGHVTPAAVDEQTHRRLAEVAERLCREIGLDDGPADFDAFLGADGEIQVVEVNARLPGQAVPMLLQEVYGVDLVAALVSMALGEPVEVHPRRKGVGILHMLSSPLSTEGMLTSVQGLDAVRALPGVARCDLFVEPGTTVPPFPQLGHDVGYLVVTGPDLASVQATVAAGLDTLRLVVVPTGGPPDGSVPPETASAPGTSTAPETSAPPRMPVARPGRPRTAEAVRAGQ